ncbi:MAG: hypothetical protein MK212_13250, partial [Saprospiraceae bacterium]|nr:hypothetical protein [Saprospiraceae bacterium]
MYKFTSTVFLLFLNSLFFSLISKAQNRGDVVSYTLLDSYNTSYIDSLLVDFGIPAGFLKPNYNVDAYKVIYITANAQGTDTTTASGLVTIPAGTNCPFPMAAYCHGTTSRRTNVPSYLTTEANIGIIFSAVDGYILAAPDYLGLGDGPGFHPYIHAASEATATIDLLRATRLLRADLGFDTNDQLFLFGYSQGGHAAMATFKEIQENYSNEFTTTACAPMSGPYDVSGVQAQTLTDSVAYATPGYLPYVVLGLQEAYGNLYTDLSEVFVPPYDSLIPTLFDGVTGLGTINNTVPDTPNLMLDSAQFTDFLNNPNNPMRIALADNDLYDWVPTAPLRMMYCTEDEQVFYLNSVVTKDTM